MADARFLCRAVVIIAQDWRLVSNNLLWRAVGVFIAPSDAFRMAGNPPATDDAKKQQPTANA
jgi:hypothetical protein